MKKNRFTFTIAVALSVAFICAMGSPLPLYAATGPDFVIGSLGDVTPGQTVTLPITVSNNPGFAAVGLAVAYDPNALEITAVTGSVADMPLNSQFALTSTPGAQWVSLVNPNGLDWYGNGTVANVTFVVKQGAMLGNSSVSLSFIVAPNGTPATASGAVLADSRTASGGMYIASGGNNVNSGGGGYNPVTPLPQATQTALPAVPPAASGSAVGGNATPRPTAVSANPPDGSATASGGGEVSDAAKREPAADSATGKVESVNEDNSGFIGNGGIANNAAADDSAKAPSAPKAAATSAPTAQVARTAFGKVPQTGTPDIAAMLAATCVCLLLSALMGSCVVHLIKRGRSNG